MAIVVQKYGGSSVADVERIAPGGRPRGRRQGRAARTWWSWSPPWATPPTSCWRWPRAGHREPRPPRAGHAALGRRAHLDGAAVDGAQRARRARRSASPARSPASSPTTPTPTRASSRCGPYPRPGRAGARQGRDRRRLPGRLVQEGGHDARPRRLRHHGGGAGGGARRRGLRDLQRRGRASTPPTRAWCPTRAGWPSSRYEEMQELAEAGAKVLNAQAVEFAKERGIAHLRPRASRGGAGETVVRKLPAARARAAWSASPARRAWCW